MPAIGRVHIDLYSHDGRELRKVARLASNVVNEGAWDWDVSTTAFDTHSRYFIEIRSADDKVHDRADYYFRITTGDVILISPKTTEGEKLTYRHNAVVNFMFYAEGVRRLLEGGFKVELCVWAVDFRVRG